MDFILTGFRMAIKLLLHGDAETYSAIFATVKVSSYSMTVSLLTGVPLGFVLGYFKFPGRKQVRVVVDTLLSLPTVFIGLVVYAFLSQRGQSAPYRFAVGPPMSVMVPRKAGSRISRSASRRTDAALRLCTSRPW